MENQCPSEEDLLAFHLGRLPANRLDAVASHLETCDVCESTLARLESTADHLLSVLAKPAPSSVWLAGSADSRGAAGARTTPQQWPSVPGYDILAQLGKGGMGVVYKAWQLQLKRAVALKRLPAGTERALGRSRAEAEALARLQHPNIVQVYEVFAHGDATYLVLELVEGGTLAAKLGKPQRPRESAELLACLAAAVHHAHALGIVHRDLKPENVLLQAGATSSAFGIPKITDFGVAKRLAASGGETRDGDVIGTPSYMSPEQAAGKLDHIGPAADVYSLGVILYELLTGRVPIQGPTTLETLARIRTEEPVPPRRLQPRLPRDLETVCLKCLDKEPGRRYASAADLAADLQRFLSNQPVRARPPSLLYRFRKFALRNKALLGGLSGIAAALIVGLAFTLFFAIGEARQHRAAVENAAAALREAYRGRIAAAIAAIQSHDVVEAAHHLAAAPETLRDWEWQHLHSRLDESSAVIRPASGERIFLLPQKGGIGLVSSTDTGFHVRGQDGRDIQTIPLKGYLPFHVGDSARDTLLIGMPDKADGQLAIVDGEGHELFRGPMAGDAASSRDAKKIAVTLPRPGAEADWFMVLDLVTGKKVECTGHGGLIYGLTFSPDGKQIASVSEDATARIWDADTGKTLTVLRGHAVKVLSAAFRADGSRVVTASADGTVRQWDPRTGREVEPPYDRHTSEVHAAVYSPDGEFIASAGADRTIRLWRAVGRRDVLVRHGNTGDVRHLVFGADGRRLASQEADGTVRIWETAPGVTLPVLAGHTSYIYPIAYSPDGRLLASGSWDGTVRLWDARTGECRHVLRHPSRVMDLAFTADGARLVTGCGEDNLLRVWDVSAGRLSKELPVGDKTLYALAIRPGTSEVAAIEKAGDLYILDIDSGKRLTSYRPKGLGKLAFSPDGRFLAFGDSGKGDVALWDVHNSRPGTELTGHSLTVTGLAFSSDGHRLASASFDRSVRIWNVDTHECVAVLTGHPDVVYSVAFHPAGKRLASAGGDGVIWLWDPETGTEVARLRGHNNYVWSLAFSPDGKTLASGSGDGTVRLWDTEPVAKRYQALRETGPRHEPAEVPAEPMIH